jgi:dTDP-glucose pyrophosphorylase
LSTLATTAVVLAGGLGSRMRRDEDGAALTEAQRTAASRGLKAMIPDARGRPFLDHILASLADAGITDVCLVVPPVHDDIRDWYRDHPPTRLRLTFAVQETPLGTANALLAAEAWLAGRDFITLNADNLYPVDGIRALVTLGEPGLIAFDAHALVTAGNIEPERIAAFAILELDATHHLTRIIEKPSEEERAAAGERPWVSMNIWRLDAAIFTACRDVPRSSRGEHELPQAVQLAITRGARFRAVTMAAPVLDLSRRGDVANVAERLAQLQATP